MQPLDFARRPQLVRPERLLAVPFTASLALALSAGLVFATPATDPCEATLDPSQTTCNNYLVSLGAPDYIQEVPSFAETGMMTCRDGYAHYYNPNILEVRMVEDPVAPNQYINDGEYTGMRIVSSVEYPCIQERDTVAHFVQSSLCTHFVSQNAHEPDFDMCVATESPQDLCWEILTKSGATWNTNFAEFIVRVDEVEFCEDTAPWPFDPEPGPIGRE